MSLLPITRTARALAWGVGLLDLVSGLGLMVRPVLALRGMLIPPPLQPESLTYVRFLGSMVAALGAVYVLAAARPDGGRLRATLELTIPFRLLAGGFVAGAIALKALDPAWLTVAAVDFALVAAQGLLVAKGAGRDA